MASKRGSCRYKLLALLAYVFIRISRASNDCASKVLDWRDDE